MVNPQIASKFMFIIPNPNYVLYIYMLYFNILHRLLIHPQYPPISIGSQHIPTASGLAAKSGFAFKGWSTVKGTFLRLEG
jgi:hypothetical protein